MNYSIEGEPLPVVICNLEPNETMITEKGAMSWMTPNMKMETTSNGGIGKMFGRAFSGESMFQNIYTARGAGLIAFGSSFPGRIMPVRLHLHPVSSAASVLSRLGQDRKSLRKKPHFSHLLPV